MTEIARARVLLALGLRDEALSLLGRLADAAEAGARTVDWSRYWRLEASRWHGLKGTLLLALRQALNGTPAPRLSGMPPHEIRLRGILPALHGLLDKVRDLGLALLEVRRISPDASKGGET